MAYQRHPGVAESQTVAVSKLATAHGDHPAQSLRPAASMQLKLTFPTSRDADGRSWDMHRNAICPSETIVQLFLLERLELGLEVVLVYVSLCPVSRWRYVRIRQRNTPTSSTMLPIPTGFEIASLISLVRSICSRMASIVWSTFSTLLYSISFVPGVFDVDGADVQTAVDPLESVCTLLHRYHCLGVEVCRFYGVDLRCVSGQAGTRVSPTYLSLQRQSRSSDTIQLVLVRLLLSERSQRHCVYCQLCCMSSDQGRPKASR
jgi:hypothetical protein